MHPRFINWLDKQIYCRYISDGKAMWILYNVKNKLPKEQTTLSLEWKWREISQKYHYE
jgi:hypothetical protein